MSFLQRICKTLLYKRMGWTTHIEVDHPESIYSVLLHIPATGTLLSDFSTRVPRASRLTSS